MNNLLIKVELSNQYKMENRFKGIKFCPDCSNMLKALEEDKTLIF